MTYSLDKNLEKKGMTRRKFLHLVSVSTAVGLTSAAMSGCAVNPVTGQSELMLVSESQEIALDKANSPHQFSADYGAVQDAQLNNYLSGVGSKLARSSHRPQMPYSFRAVNATYVNAYAFPGGSIAATRGILLELENEAELAALMGHEVGHVNHRHSASRMSQGMLAQAVVAGASIYASTQGSGMGALVSGLGGIGAGMLLASYSRDDEREADARGMEYSTKVGLNPQGMIGLMDVLVSMHKTQPNALERMFSTHPMSTERYQTAMNQAQGAYSYAANFPVNRERYMDSTARLRRSGKAIKTMQKGEEYMSFQRYDQAANSFGQALKYAPNDYAGLVMMANCQTAMDRYNSAARYANKATQIYPQEGQAHHALGVASLLGNSPGKAYQEFSTYDRMLPGNPQTSFLKGVSLDEMGQTQNAAQEYNNFLRQVNQGSQASYAYQRMVGWGYYK